CIGSSFNASRRMICPNCRVIEENGDWMQFINGDEHVHVHEHEHEDEEENDDEERDLIETIALAAIETHIEDASNM
ncbi:hypothetical protein HAX54_015848, partial [Datura stramonium]|nr:hypothetical protein [Datura stramonium]